MTGKADKGRYTRKKSDTKFTAVKGERVISKLAVAFTAPHSLRSRKNLYVKFVPLCLCIVEKEMAPTPVFLPGESQGRGSLVGCCLWGRTELDTTEAT